MIKGPHFSEEVSHIIHFVMEWSAMFVGIMRYKYQQKMKPVGRKTPLPILVGCVMGAALGNKLLFLAEMPQAWQMYGWQALFMGQTIVGGLLGGLLGVEVAKFFCGYVSSTGDDFIIPLTLGIVVGRIGCFLAGLHDGTYGVATDLPWAMDFGDGVGRHPTQVYDQLAVIGLAVIALSLKSRLAKGGAFKVYLAGYLLWRLGVDSIKPVPYSYYGLSGIQWGCFVALLFYLPFVVKSFRVSR